MVYKGKGLGHGTGHDSDLLPKNEKYSPRGWRWSSYLNWNRPLYLSTLMSDKSTFFQVMLPAACEGRKLLDSMSGCNSFGHWKCTANWALARYLLGNCFAWRQNLRRLQVCLKVAVVTVRMRNAFFVHIFISSSHLFIPLLPLLISWRLISLSLVTRMSCGGGRWEPLHCSFIDTETFIMSSERWRCDVRCFQTNMSLFFNNISVIFLKYLNNFGRI